MPGPQHQGQKRTKQSENVFAVFAVESLALLDARQQKLYYEKIIAALKELGITKVKLSNLHEHSKIVTLVEEIDRRKRSLNGSQTQTTDQAQQVQQELQQIEAKLTAIRRIQRVANDEAIRDETIIYLRSCGLQIISDEPEDEKAFYIYVDHQKEYLQQAMRCNSQHKNKGYVLAQKVPQPRNSQGNVKTKFDTKYYKKVIKTGCDRYENRNKRWPSRLTGVLGGLAIGALFVVPAILTGGLSIPVSILITLGFAAAGFGIGETINRFSSWRSNVAIKRHPSKPIPKYSVKLYETNDKYKVESNRIKKQLRNSYAVDNQGSPTTPASPDANHGDPLQFQTVSGKKSRSKRREMQPSADITPRSLPHARTRRNNIGVPGKSARTVGINDLHDNLSSTQQPFFNATPSRQTHFSTEKRPTFVATPSGLSHHDTKEQLYFLRATPDDVPPVNLAQRFNYVGGVSDQVDEGGRLAATPTFPSTPTNRRLSSTQLPHLVATPTRQPQSGTIETNRYLARQLVYEAQGQGVQNATPTTETQAKLVPNPDADQNTMSRKNSY